MDKIQEILSKRLDGKRYLHSLGVRDEAVCLAEHYGADVNKSALAGLVHDCCKGIPQDEERQLFERYELKLDDICCSKSGLLHAPLGAEYARAEFSVEDEEVLEAIRCHTTGKPAMSLLDKIIYIADYIEPSRKGYYWFPAMRCLAYQSLDDAVLMGLNLAITYILDKNEPLHPNTTDARNYYLIQGK